jgi:regulator of PEP synthase PpsR (kinase-PPPase family)
MFGLMTTADVLVTIRRRRLGRALAVAGDYANPESVEKDLEKARALMRKLRCIVVHTDNRAVEETAQEILRYYDLAHPESSKVDSSIEN